MSRQQHFKRETAAKVDKMTRVNRCFKCTETDLNLKCCGTPADVTAHRLKKKITLRVCNESMKFLVKASPLTCSELEQEGIREG
jgi:hypothetical protein